MPQMSPLNWLMLFIIFIIIFMMFNSLNYFNFFYKPSKTQQLKKKIHFNWKW
uniref:ATP synthase complex subunit 8 n=1 Tax=Carpelimus bilineatus TaxID=346749 RepID=A0A0S2M6Z1_9COLE|nr:ATP synthase F0 subunit 8 [Carpelimus bilineatus]